MPSAVLRSHATRSTRSSANPFAGCSFSYAQTDISRSGERHLYATGWGVRLNRFGFSGFGSRLGERCVDRLRPAGFDPRPTAPGLALSYVRTHVDGQKITFLTKHTTDRFVRTYVRTYTNVRPYSEIPPTCPEPFMFTIGSGMKFWASVLTSFVYFL